MSLITRYRAAADRAMDTAENAPATPARTPLTTNQHILFLLLTVFTGGLAAPVWFVRAWRGNPPQR